VLVAGFWSLVTGFWLLASGRHGGRSYFNPLLWISYHIFPASIPVDTCYSMLDTFYPVIFSSCNQSFCLNRPQSCRLKQILDNYQPVIKK
jgi:hypothetical protein